MSTADDWMRRMVECRSPLGRRLMLAIVALDPKTDRISGEAREAALTEALGCTKAELYEAIVELKRVGLAEFGWMQ